MKWLRVQRWDKQRAEMQRLPWFALVAVLAMSLFAVWFASDPHAQAQARKDRYSRATSSGKASGKIIRRGPSEVIFPSKSMNIRSEHARHAAAGIRCEACHQGAATSARASDRLLPKAGTCDRCHGPNHQRAAEKKANSRPSEDLKQRNDAFSGGRFDTSSNKVNCCGGEYDDNDSRVSGSSADGGGAGGSGSGNSGTAQIACGACHLDYNPAGKHKLQLFQYIKPRLKFSHRLHARRNIGCGNCHGAVHKRGQAGRQALPTMRSCLRCHGQDASSRGDAKAECATCHLTDASGRMRTVFDNGKLIPPEWLAGAQHGADFTHNHGKVAGRDSQFCAQCHTEASCARCHDGRVRVRNIHPNDYLSMHAAEAKQSANSCTSCHRYESFCKSCHMRAGVSWTGPVARQSARGTMHGDARTFVYGPMTGAHHGVQARRNLMSCVGCHSERDCASCHATKAGGGMGVNPHPRNFSTRCRAALRANARSCAVCHDSSDPVFLRCN